jgi:hypothetical protein
MRTFVGLPGRRLSHSYPLPPPRSAERLTPPTCRPNQTDGPELARMLTPGPDHPHRGSKPLSGPIRPSSSRGRVCCALVCSQSKRLTAHRFLWDVELEVGRAVSWEMMAQLNTPHRSPW